MKKTLLLLALYACFLASQNPAFARHPWLTGKTDYTGTRPLLVPEEPVVAQKSISSNSVQSLAAPSAPENFAAQGLPLPIPDNNSSGITASFSVPASPFYIASVAVDLNITHTYRGDLVVTLISPDGTIASISNQQGGSTDNIILTNFAVSGFAGVRQGGVWQLKVADVASGDSGTLNSASLTITLGTDATTVFDVVMSISADPRGDNNGNTQPGGASAEQDVWERIVQHYADAVFEATNGVHKIGNVRIFRKGRLAKEADIIWTQLGHPHVDFKGGVGETGGHVNMYEIFKDGEGTGTNHDMLNDEKGSGYTMAHEWGHYFYGLYDEYPLNNTDVGVQPSIMANQWRARSEGARWLNFSIPKNGSGGNFQDTGLNGQHRQHNASAWETLTRPVANDVKSATDLPLGRRIYYPELIANAPATGSEPTIELSTLPGTTANSRSDLNIIWDTDLTTFELIIDHSGSMADESKMDQARTAAKLFIDQCEFGKTQVGIIKFDSNVNIVSPVIEISNQADKDSLKNLIDQISPAGGTAIGDAMQSGLNNLLTTNADLTRVAFLLTDGQSNEGVDPATVVPSYQQAQIPLFTFGFGSDADEITLLDLATKTGGKFYFSPTSAGAISAAFQDAQASSQSLPGIAGGSFTAPVGIIASLVIPVDLGLSGLNITISYSGSVSDATIVLSDPTGTPIPASAVYSGNSGDTVLSYNISASGFGKYGDWKINAQSGQSPLLISYNVTSNNNGTGYNMSFDTLDGVKISDTSKPVILTARLFKDAPVVGTNVTGTFSDNNGQSYFVIFHDDGQNGDSVAGDGISTGIFQPTTVGTYNFRATMDNTSGLARLSYGNSINSADVNGSEPSQLPDVSIMENFSRSETLQVQVSQGLTPPPAYTIGYTAIPINGGTVIGAGTFNAGTEQTLTAIPNNNYVFKNWTESGIVVSTSASYTFNVTGGRFLVANFIPSIKYRINAIAKPKSKGTVSGGGTYSAGSLVTLKAKAKRGKKFVGWSKGSGKRIIFRKLSYTISVTGDVTYYANFR